MNKETYGKVKRWVGIGWLTEGDATPEDYNLFPVVVEDD